MTMRSIHGWGTVMVAIFAVSAAGAGEAPKSGKAEPTYGMTAAVFAKIDKDYQRRKLPDGTFVPEYYALSNAGYASGTERDRSMEKVDFPQLAGVLAELLAQQNYFMARDSKTARLLIVVHWGRTIPSNNPNYEMAVSNAAQAMQQFKGMGEPDGGGVGSNNRLSPEQQAASDDFESAMMALMMENTARDQANKHNSQLLGYAGEMQDSDDIRRVMGYDMYYQLQTDIEQPRYYIIVSAYDFRKTVLEKQPKLLWVTRMSLRASGHDFSKEYEQLLATASRYFGKESGGLLRRYETRTKIEFGELQVIEDGDESTPAPNATRASDGEPAEAE